MIVRPSYRDNGNLHSGQTVSSYWDSPLVPHICECKLSCHRFRQWPIARSPLSRRLNWWFNCRFSLLIRTHCAWLFSWNWDNQRVTPIAMREYALTHWGRDKIHTISQTTFSSEFSWMKMHEFRLIFHWSLFLRVPLTIFQHWFR